MDILITRHLTIRPLLEVDADDIRELITKEPELIAKLPRVFIALIGSDDAHHHFFATRTLVVIREKLIGWVSLDEADGTGFSARGQTFRAEAVSAAQHYFAALGDVSLPNAFHQQQSAQFAA
ncbi:MAG: hypothetical protein ACRCT6_12815 [Notoacmeibacter sp.]